MGIAMVAVPRYWFVPSEIEASKYHFKTKIVYPVVLRIDSCLKKINNVDDNSDIVYHC